MSTEQFDATLQYTRDHVSQRVTDSPLYTYLLSNVVVKSASSSSVICHLKLEPQHMNSKGGIHGAVSATIVDFIGGVAIAAYDQRSQTGVSTDIHVTYLSSAKTGDTIEIEGRAPKVGGSLAFTECVIRKIVEGKGKEDWPIVSKGSHTKFVRTK